MILSEEEIKGKILYNIKRKREQYINKRNAVKSFPPHLTKEVTKILDSMVKEGLLIPFKKGDCVGVNISRKEEVLRLIKIHLDRRYQEY